MLECNRELQSPDEGVCEPLPSVPGPYVACCGRRGPKGSHFARRGLNFPRDARQETWLGTDEMQSSPRRFLHLTTGGAPEFLTRPYELSGLNRKEGDPEIVSAVKFLVRVARSLPHRHPLVDQRAELKIAITSRNLEQEICHMQQVRAAAVHLYCRVLN